MEISKLYYAFGIGFEDSHMRDLFSEYMMNAKKELLVFREEKIPAMDSGEDYKDYYDNKLKQHGSINFNLGQNMNSWETG